MGITFTDEELRRIAALLWDHEEEEEQARPAPPPRAGRCPECGESLIPAGGCRICPACGWEACGF